MDEFKKTYLVDFSINMNDLRTCEYQDDYDARLAANTLSKFFRPGEIKLLQIRIRYDKIEDDDE